MSVFFIASLLSIIFSDSPSSLVRPFLGLNICFLPSFSSLHFFLTSYFCLLPKKAPSPPTLELLTSSFLKTCWVLQSCRLRLVLWMFCPLFSQNLTQCLSGVVMLHITLWLTDDWLNVWWLNEWMNDVFMQNIYTQVLSYTFFQEGGSVLFLFKMIRAATNFWAPSYVICYEWLLWRYITLKAGYYLNITEEECILRAINWQMPVLTQLICTNVEVWTGFISTLYF